MASKKTHDLASQPVAEPSTLYEISGMANVAATIRPICFMVMPFGKKAVLPRPDKAPATIDFDALWLKALKPLLRELGYEPVRADQDLGALIIHEMIERLYFSDLVLADLTIPNANVYYEIGIRHASRKNGCVLVAADWASPVFDIAQMRRLTYPLPSGEVSDTDAEAIREALKKGVVELAQGEAPMYSVLPGYPDEKAIDPNRARAIKDTLAQMSDFQARIHAAKHESDKTVRAKLIADLCAANPAKGPISPAVALEMVTLLRDSAGWRDMVEYVNELPRDIQALDFIQEQRILATSKTGSHLEAIGALQELIKMRGETSERYGLIGGRYKKLYGETKSPVHLDRAIEAYERGMNLDLNDYFPSCNLPRLYRLRNEDEDAEKAVFTAKLALAACTRAKERDPSDEWIRPTLLGMAFDAADVSAAKKLAKEVRNEGAASWKLKTTLSDLKVSVTLAPPEKRAPLEAVTRELDALLSPE